MAKRNRGPKGREFNPENAAEMGRRGGIASGQSRRRARMLSELAATALHSPVDARSKPAMAARSVLAGLDPEDMTTGALVIAGQVNSAIKGNAQSFALLREMEAEQAAREAEGARPFERDVQMLVGPAFWRVRWLVERGEETEFWMPGGRGSGKSSAISILVVDGMMRHPDRSAYVFQAVQGGMEGGVFEQVRWAIQRLGVEDQWECRKSPMLWRRRETGQVIRFKGLDDAGKTKATKAPAGTYYAYQWFEEVDQLSGTRAIRTALQSLTRDVGGDAYFCRFYSFNPPRVAESWVNRVCERREAEGKAVFPSTYLDLPREWVSDQMAADAEELRRTDPQAYEHEYLGKSVGIGGKVFDRVVFREVTDEEIAASDNLRVGQDFGWWPDPWAVTVSDWRPGRRTLVTFAEEGGNKVQPPEQARRLRRLLTWRDAGRSRARLHADPVWSDDADPSAIAQQRDSGANARPAGKGGLRMASYRFLSGVTWVIDPRRCPRLAEEVRRKQYRALRDGRFVEEIPDGDDHWIDATRYALMQDVRRRSAYRGNDDPRAQDAPGQEE